MSIPQQGGGPIESRNDLVEYLSSGCKPPEDWRIGTEHEKFGYRLSDHMPLPYDGACSIRAMLEGMRDRFGWTPVIESGNIIGLEKDGANENQGAESTLSYILSLLALYNLRGLTVKQTGNGDAELASSSADDSGVRIKSLDLH